MDILLLFFYLFHGPICANELIKSMQFSFSCCKRRYSTIYSYSTEVVVYTMLLHIRQGTHVATNDVPIAFNGIPLNEKSISRHETRKVDLALGPQSNNLHLSISLFSHTQTRSIQHVSFDAPALHRYLHTTRVKWEIFVLKLKVNGQYTLTLIGSLFWSWHGTHTQTESNSGSIILHLRASTNCFFIMQWIILVIIECATKYIDFGWRMQIRAVHSYSIVMCSPVNIHAIIFRWFTLKISILPFSAQQERDRERERAQILYTIPYITIQWLSNWLQVVTGHW